MTTPTEFARRRGEKKPRPRSHVSFVDLAGLVVVGAVLYFAVPAWASSDDGRETLARQIEHIIGDQIRGSLSIGSLDRVGHDGIVGRDIVFRDESGRTVLVADEAELAIDWDALVAGHFVSPHGTVRGGRVMIETLPSGVLLVDRAFESAHPGAEGAPVGEDVVRLEHLDVIGVTVVIGIHGGPEIRARRVSTEVTVRAPENGSAIIAAARIRAQLHLDAPLPIDMDVTRGRFHLDGSARRRAHMDFPSRVGGEPVRMTVTVLADAQDSLRLDVHLHPESVGAVFTAGHLFAQTAIADSMSDTVSVNVDF